MPNETSLAGAAISKDEVFDTLVEDILTSRLAPGEALIERSLAERFGISRTPIREVLLRLQAEYLVDFFPHQGAFVRKMTPQDVRELFELREALEPLAAKLAAMHRPELGLAEISGLFDNQPQLENSTPEQLIALGQTLHDTIVRWSGNRLLGDLYSTVRKRTRLVRSMTRARKDIELNSLREHRSILEAVASKDEEAAYKRMLQHLQRSNVDAMQIILSRGL